MDNEKKLIVLGLKKLIEVRGWSKAEFARNCKIARQNVNDYLELKLNPENLLLPLFESGEDIEWIKSGGRGESIKGNVVKEKVDSYWESRSSHMTEKERKDLDKFINELLNEDQEDRRSAINVARLILNKGKKKKV